MANIESYFNLRNTPESGGNPGEFKLSHEIAVICKGPFALEDLEKSSFLLVKVSREGLSLPGRDSGVPWDEGCHNTTVSFNSQGVGSNINQEHVIDQLGLVT